MAELTFNWIDYAIIGVIVVSLIIGVFRGFVKELFSLLSWILAIWVSVHYCKPLAKILSAHIHPKTLALVVAFASIFIICVLLGAIVNLCVSKLVHRVGLGGADRSLGVLFGLIRGCLLVLVLLWLGQVTQWSEHKDWKQSYLLQTLMPLSQQFDRLIDRLA